MTIYGLYFLVTFLVNRSVKYSISTDPWRFTSFLHCIINQALKVHYENIHISSIPNGVIISRVVSLLRIITLFDLIKWIKLKQMVVELTE